MNSDPSWTECRTNGNDIEFYISSNEKQQDKKKGNLQTNNWACDEMNRML